MNRLLGLVERERERERERGRGERERRGGREGEKENRLRDGKRVSE